MINSDFSSLFFFLVGLHLMKQRNILLVAVLGHQHRSVLLQPYHLKAWEGRKAGLEVSHREGGEASRPAKIKAG